MNVFLICPVRNATEEQKDALNKYIAGLEEWGCKVHYPARDTNQSGNGVKICADNRRAIESADEVHIFFDPTSTGTMFDIGMAFALRKKVVVVNEVLATEQKSFNNVLLGWEDARWTY